MTKREENTSPRSRSAPASRPTGVNPYNTVAASKRRAERRARSGDNRRSVTDLDALEMELARPNKPKKENELDQATIADILANPTRMVSEEELRAEYTYVLNDLRSMGILAVGLVGLLVVLAQILPR